jgi:carboxypeptidase Q
MDPRAGSLGTMRSSPRLLLVLAVSSALFAQVTPDQFEAIRKEGLTNSKVMDHLDHLVNRIGPRLTGSDNLTVAGEWARDTFQAMGLEVRLEQWGEFAVGFNRGPWWGRMTSPEPMELVCNTDAWTAGTRMPSRGKLVPAPKTSEELAALQGKLAKVWLLNPPAAMMKELTAAMESEGASASSAAACRATAARACC